MFRILALAALVGRMTFRSELLLALLVSLLLPFASLADVAGTGTYSADLPLPSGAFAASATFNNVSYDVLGQSTVNLGTLVGSMSLASTWDSSSCTFTDTSNASDLAFISTGRCTCIENCGDSFPKLDIRGVFVSTSLTGISGTAVDGGPGTLPTGSDIYYSYNGTALCDQVWISGEIWEQACTGNFAWNVFQSAATATGEDVSASSSGEYFNTVDEEIKNFSVDVTFDSVDSAGDTLILASSGSPAINIPNDFAANVGGYNATFIDVVTTATHSGNVEACTTYPDLDQDGLVDGTSVVEEAVRLLHDEAGTFVDRTTSIDTVLNQVCASTTSLSFFVPALYIPVPSVSPVGLFLVAAGLLGFGAYRRGRA